ncbi:MAG: hypothetical protein GYB65_21630, partial [Chloroflexi bacterium]|nr:hypothetical protein [Chloroflexota bacterium]
AFRRGYERVLPWPEQFPGELETWIVQRALAMLNYEMQAPTQAERDEVPFWLDTFHTCMDLLKDRRQPAAV